jgi:hypothetical protein
MPTPERHVLLHLDLATANPIPMDAVRLNLPADANIREYRMTDHGAEPMPYGSRERGWHLWARSFEAMLKTARRECEDGRSPPRYHVMGRAALPMAAYAGLALSGATHVTVHNPSRKTPHLDSFALEQPSSAAATPFFTVDRLEKRSDPRGPIALCVGLGQPFSHHSIADFLQRQGCPCAAALSLNTPPNDPRVLDAEHAPAALWQLTSRILGLRRQHEHSRGLVLFCAGPMSLAVAVGWALNPRIYGPLWIPNYDNGTYRPALHFPLSGPRRHEPRILLLTAAPQNEGSIDLQRQHRAVQDALRPVESRCKVILSTGIRGTDLADKLREHSPEIIHILAHGTDKGGMYAVSADAQLQAVEIIQRELVEILRQGDPPPRLVLLHICSAGGTAERLAQDFDMTIGATETLWQDTAAAFSTEFYGALASGLSLRAAHDRTMLNLGILEKRGLQSIHAYHCPTGDQGEWIPFPR